MAEPFHPDELALLAAIHADPLNDAPRLALADWLQHHGHSGNAEFIRLQCVQPYIGVTPLQSSESRFSAKFAWQYGQQEEEDRLKRLLALSPEGYRVGLISEFHEEQFRGLPLLEKSVHGDMQSRATGILDRVGPAARFDLMIEFLLLPTSQLTDWLASPLMERVEILTLSPTHLGHLEPAPDDTSHHFTLGNLLTLADSPVLDRLYELRFQGILSSEAEEAARELLEPRVRVTYHG